MGKKPTRCDLCEFLLFYAVIFGSPSSKIKIFASKGNEYLNNYNSVYKAKLLIIENMILYNFNTTIGILQLLTNGEK